MNDIPLAMAAGIELSLNRYLSLDPLANKKMQSLSGKVFAIELRDFNLRFHIIPSEAKTLVKGNIEQAADTTLAGTSVSMLKMSLQDNASDSLLKGDVKISGNVELGEEFQSILDSIDIDWEEQLSKVTGDVVAHQVGNVVRNAAQWARKTADILTLDVSEYLHEESRDLPVQNEVEQFIKQIDETRMDVDRLDARIKRLDARFVNDANKN